MNKENAHAYLPLVQAVAAGKTLQVLGNDGNWYNTKLIHIPPHRFRIKPEPRQFEVWLNAELGVMHPVEGTELNCQDYGWERITVTEVLK